MMYPRIFHHLIAVAALAGLLSSCGLRRHKYADPITKNTEQPDKVLFDRAINDIEHSRYEIARLTLQTLINTYDSSEFLAKAKLAIADSWFREGLPPILIPELGRVQDEEAAVEAHYRYYSIVRYSEQWNNSGSSVLRFIGSETELI